MRNIRREQPGLWLAIVCSVLWLEASGVTSAQPPSNQPPAAAPVEAAPEPSPDYREEARQVTDEIQRDFCNPQTGLYWNKPSRRDRAAAWDYGVLFSALVGATRNDPEHYQPLLRRSFEAFNAYWDGKQALGGYEPLPANGDGHDKYYDDNEWLAITFLEAFAVTGEPAYRQRAEETLKFVLSGWDDTVLHGGIWWHETHEKKNREKNTCANAPAAVACLGLARISPPAQAPDLIAMARKLADWTAANLQLPNGLLADNKNIDDGHLNKRTFTYNSALTERAFLGLYRVGGNPADLQKAQRIALAANALLDPQTGVYHDSKMFGHLMVEADLALYRTTKEPYLLERARRNADAYYASWKNDGPVNLITVSSIARVLWLMADLQAPSGRKFWQQEDLPDLGQRQ